MQIDWSILIPVSIPLLAATLAQIIAHALANKRENIKYKKECFQNLYSPLILLINDYYENEIYKSKLMNLDRVTEEEIHKLNDPNEKFQGIMKIISQNLKYAEHDLISQFHITRNFHQCENWIQANHLKFQLMYAFCKNFNKIANDLKIKMPKITEDIIFHFHFYQMLNKCYVSAIDDDLYNFSKFAIRVHGNRRKKCFKLLKWIENIDNNFHSVFAFRLLFFSKFYRNFTYRRTFTLLDIICKDLSKEYPHESYRWNYVIKLGRSHIID
ncbi:hypothetical protein [Bacillus pumilus]|uniref:hypothetical protein n=1 Tax=Bacillus pumilus TaxID=1408 RepID=UPI000B42DB14|nr:hypothetical protein [Bacillus pumilus]OUZ06952.1 hypothetical protein BHE94_14365 [Bacillus pumilus]